MLWQASLVLAPFRRGHPLSCAGVPCGALGEEEAGPRVVAQVPRVVVGEVATPRLRRAPSRARREARQPGEVGDQLVTTVRAVVEARAGVQLAGPAGAGPVPHQLLGYSAVTSQHTTEISNFDINVC